MLDFWWTLDKKSLDIGIKHMAVLCYGSGRHFEINKKMFLCRRAWGIERMKWRSWFTWKKNFYFIVANSGILQGNDAVSFQLWGSSWRRLRLLRTMKTCILRYKWQGTIHKITRCIASFRIKIRVIKGFTTDRTRDPGILENNY